MCGIWALFGADVATAFQCGGFFRIAHRGPDCSRLETIPGYRNCAMGFHRLAIVDKNHGMQPQRLNHLPHLWMCTNGEIYNYKLVEKEFHFNYETAMDCESIIHLYHHGGIEFMAQRLDGVFAMCLLDTKRQLVHLVRDTFGVRPLFRMLTDDGMMAVCSEAKGLVDILANDTATNRINLVLPGHYESYKLLESGKVEHLKTERFHDIAQAPIYKTLINHLDEDIYSNIRGLLRAAIKKRFTSTCRVGCLLSGGVDSSLVAALVCEVAAEEGVTSPVQTFVTGMKGSPDIAAARKVAAHIGSEHHEVSFTPQEVMEHLASTIYHLESYDISVVRDGLPLYLLSRYIAKETGTVVLFSGEGADEVMQGYYYFHHIASADAGHLESLRLCRDLHLFDVLRADRTVAAHGLELRVPYLDHQFSAYYMSLPAGLRQAKDGVEKKLLRQAFDGTGLLPSEVLWRKKEGLSRGVLANSEQTLLDVVKEASEEEGASQALRVKSLVPIEDHTKEGDYYRAIFEKHFPGRSHWVPRYWNPFFDKGTETPVRKLGYYISGHRVD